MSYSRSKVVAQAKSWMGRKESDGSHKDIINLYNAHSPRARGYKVKYTDKWCATFVSAVSIKCGYTSIMPTECSCSHMIARFKKIGVWKEQDSFVPSPGDVIFYDWHDSGSGDNKGNPDHVGIVEKVSGKTITVIEGNISDSVGRRQIKVNGKSIRGYGVPKFSTSAASTKTSTVKKNNTSTKKLAVDGDWGKLTTTASQKVFGTKADGIVSNQPESCKKYVSSASTSSWKFKSSNYGSGSSLIKAIQKRVGATVDGLCGKDTVSRMQSYLNKIGIGVGSADGYMGPKTVKGWQKYINGKL